MKKFFAVLCVICTLLTSGVAFAADDMDFTSMSDDELYALVDGARNELAKRELVAEADTVILEQDGVTVYLTGDTSESTEAYAYFEAVVVNDRDKTVSVSVESASINGWDVYGDGIYETSPGKKQKGEFTFSLEDCDLTDVSEIEDLQMELKIIDSDDFSTIADGIQVALTFNAG